MPQRQRTARALMCNRSKGRRKNAVRRRSQPAVVRETCDKNCVSASHPFSKRCPWVARRKNPTGQRRLGSSDSVFSRPCGYSGTPTLSQAYHVGAYGPSRGRWRRAIRLAGLPGAALEIPAPPRRGDVHLSRIERALSQPSAQRASPQNVDVQVANALRAVAPVVGRQPIA